MSREQIANLVGALADAVNTLRNADPHDKAEVYCHLGLHLRYEPDRNVVRAEVRVDPRGALVRVGGGT